MIVRTGAIVLGSICAMEVVEKHVVFWDDDDDENGRWAAGDAK